jgi:hypothetical protein
VSQYTGITQLDGKTLTYADYEAAFQAVKEGDPSSEQESMVLLYEGFCQAVTEGTTQTLCASAYDSVVIAKNPFSAKGTKVLNMRTNEMQSPKLYLSVSLHIYILNVCRVTFIIICAHVCKKIEKKVVVCCEERNRSFGR